MPSLKRVSTALEPFVSRRNLCRHRVSNYPNVDQIRRVSSIAGTNVFHSTDKTVGIGYRDYIFPDCGDSQRRGFFGFNGGSMLSKVYEERRVMGYSPEQLFDVVAAVDLYQDFLPWCQRSDIIRRNPDGTLEAELEIGFKFFVESYISRVELKKPKSIKSTSSQSSVFDHLINIWEFNPGPRPGTCNLYLLVDFKFQSPLYTHVANASGKEVVSRLVGSFNDRCRLIYGPGLPVHGNSYGHRT